MKFIYRYVIISDSIESRESGILIENNADIRQENTYDVGVLPINSERINVNNHVFCSKTVIRPEDCDVCEKKWVKYDTFYENVAMNLL